MNFIDDKAGKPIGINETKEMLMAKYVDVPVTKIRAYFTPGHMVENAIAEEIGGAQRVIRFQAYSFTNPVIVQALADAQMRGVDVMLILDKSNRTQKYSATDYASHAGIPTLIDDRHAIALEKLGMSAANLAQLKSAVARPYGLVLCDFFGDQGRGAVSEDRTRSGGICGKTCGPT